MPAIHIKALKVPVITGIIAGLLATLAACASIDRIKGYEDPAKLSAAYYQRAMNFMAGKMYPQAVTDFQRAITADQDMYQAYYQLGRVYQAQGKAEHARRIWVAGLAKAQSAPERKDYPRARAIAELRAALAGNGHAASAAPPRAAMRPMAKPPIKTTAAPPPVAKRPAASHGGSWAVLVSSNLKRSSAEGDVRRLKAKGYKATIKTHRARGRTWHRVWVGCCTSFTVAKKRARSLNASGLARGAAAMKP